MRSSGCRVIDTVLGFLESVLMGCFVSCFRIRDDDRKKSSSIAKPISSQYKDCLLPKKKIDPVLLCQDRRPSPSSQVNLFDNSSANDLEHQAKYLRACGALIEVPAEIQNPSDKVIRQTQDDENASPEFRSWLPGTPIAVFQSTDCPSDTPSEVQIDSGDPEKEHESFKDEISEVQEKAVQFGRTVASGDELEDKSCEADLSPLHSESKVKTFCSSDSPFATPLNITDEMETPATVYPVSMDIGRTRKHTRIRTEHVCSVLKPVENLPQSKAFKEVNYNYLASGDLSGYQKSSSKVDQHNPDKKRHGDQHNISMEESACMDFSSNLADSMELPNFCLKTPKIATTSSSEWIESQILDHNGETHNYITDVQAERAYDADRPIIGLVASHWINDESTHIMPKWWNGNGIPNSTRKYKEDQKVSWHATPFEERLEKVLSGEERLPRRMPQYKLSVEFETEGSE